MKRGITAPTRAAQAIFWLLYVLLVPIHLFSTEHFFSPQETSESHERNSNHHHGAGNHQDGQHIPHYVGDHSLNATLQKSLSIVKHDLVLNYIGLALNSAFVEDQPFPILRSTLSVSSVPPEIAQSRAPPSI